MLAQLMSYNDQSSALTLSDFLKANHGKTRDEIINQAGSATHSYLWGLIEFESTPGGPDLRYIADPVNSGAVIDLTHMLIVGREGELVGNALEHGQALRGSSSGGNFQDYYSNNLGYQFYSQYGAAIQANPQKFTTYLSNFLTNPNNPRINFQGLYYHVK